MFQKQKYIVPEGVVQCFLNGGEHGKAIYGPGEHDCDLHCKPFYIESAAPHLEHSTVTNMKWSYNCITHPKICDKP